MIRFNLCCDNGHHFFSWFASGDTFERLQKAARIECTVCGSKTVEKALMAPSVTSSREAAVKGTDPAPQTPEDALIRRLAAFRRHIEETSDYVGVNFATEARAMHLGEAPERPIYGEARIEEARALTAEGIAVAPLPFIPKAKSN